jgi:peptide/nickel transport system ATP-binding protein
VSRPLDAGAPTPLVAMRGVSKRFVKTLDIAGRIGRRLGADVREEIVHAVDRVDLDVAPGEVVGLVGESGCGKSTLGRLAVGLLPLSDGERFWKGAPLGAQAPAAARLLQLKMQMIFQDPYAALNPRMRVIDIVGEAPVVHGIIAPKQRVEYVGLMLNRVGLDPTLMRRYPHQFSGGQRARIGIARALAVKPEFLVCDESVAALDVSIQAQVLNLFMELKGALSLTYLFISHDLGVVKFISDRVVVMYLGRVVESAPADELFARPNHPYTRALLAEVGRVEPRKRTFVPIKGEIPSPLAPPPGCHFHPRCPYAMPICQQSVPALDVVAPDHRSACWLNVAPAAAMAEPVDVSRAVQARTARGPAA